jgi:addiction module HigA family antidote
MSVVTLAVALHVPVTHLQGLVDECNPITPDTAERLTGYFGGDGASWLNLQSMYNLKTLDAQD